jgi:ATP-dependent RNA helicase DDX56/DBP9
LCAQDVENLKQLILHSPAVLKLEDVEDTSASKLMQHSIECSEGDKFLLAYFMVKMGLLGGKGIFFVNDIDRCFKLKLFFERFFIKAALLNSELPQNSRCVSLRYVWCGVVRRGEAKVPSSLVVTNVLVSPALRTV